MLNKQIKFNLDILNNEEGYLKFFNIKKKNLNILEFGVHAGISTKLFFVTFSSL